MAIDVEWQDERGKRLSRYDGPPIDSRLPDSASPDSVCLRFIDPYGDTTFNQAQVAELEKELATVDGAGDVAQQAKSLLSFVKQVHDRTHRYLKFIGD
ncbi:MAG TPA: hypothetical protein VGR35_23250 [Tepidisphaeraceae bacterium]|nr:hypothetical protein [Tepidisphaeraceae bacterium]